MLRFQWFQTDQAEKILSIVKISNRYNKDNKAFVVVMATKAFSCLNKVLEREVFYLGL